ncbi:MAG TPA: sugar phosphate isomerase/epimerase family protein [Anaerolineales bacterium]
MIKLSYCTFGLTQLTLPAAIEAVHNAGYPGVELSFHRDQFNPFNLTQADLERLRRQFETLSLKPACVATASHFFTPSRPHEPSLLCLDLAGRKRRIGVVKRGIQVARALKVPLVTFGSGFIRDEHVAHPSIDPGGLLVDSIRRCLEELRADDDLTLLIEPEPGMYIETLDQAIDLVNEVNSPRFQLHLDLCHIYCSESNMTAALTKAAPYARYLHVSDAEAGCNLKIITAAPNLTFDMDFADFLVYFPNTADFLLLNRDHPLYFFDEQPGAQERSVADGMKRNAGIAAEIAYVDYNSLISGASEFDDEIFTYLISVPSLSFDVLERARPILIYLRTARGSSGLRLMDRRVANTLTGIVHFHEIPGHGTLDFAGCFRALTDNGFSGYASVELYHHVAEWEQALRESYAYLSTFV